jgi:hypothetical protein
LTIAPSFSFQSITNTLETLTRTLHLAVTLAAKRHAAPVAWATHVAPRLQMGALDHVDAVIGRVLDNGTGLKSLAQGELAGGSAGESQEAEE